MLPVLGSVWYQRRMRVRGLVFAAAVAAGFAPPSADAARLNTSDIIGTWLGSCEQVETLTSRRVTGRFEQLSPKLILGSWQTDDMFFGCPATDPGGYPLTKGGRRNGFTAHSLRVKSRSFVEPFGRVTVTTRGTTFIVSGKNACNGQGPKKYGGKGKLEGGNLFTLEMKGTLAGEVVHYRCSWNKA